MRGHQERALLDAVGQQCMAAFARDVAVLPTGIDLRPFPEDAIGLARQARRGSAAPRIGWVGSGPSLRYLGSLAEPLRRLCARRPQLRFVQVCNAFVEWPGIPTETIAWSPESETAALLGLDIGVMPLDDSPFSQGKCGLKILMYQAAGLPVVCSPVGANRELVEDGRTGLFAVTAGDWVDRLSRLLDDPALGRTLGERGRARVLERYGSVTIASRLAELVGSVAGT